MPTQQDIKQKLQSIKAELFSRYPIATIALFGSYARNDQTPNSDVDILVEFNGKIGIRFIDLANEMEEILGVKVDLVSRNGIKDRYFKAIQQELVYV